MGMEEENSFIRDKSLVSVFDRFRLKRELNLGQVGCKINSKRRFYE